MSRRPSRSPESEQATDATLPAGPDIGQAPTIRPTRDDIPALPSAKDEPFEESSDNQLDSDISEPSSFSELSTHSGLAASQIRGKYIGRYKLIGLIGAGGMGIVYAARDRELGRRVAIKVLRPEISELDDTADTLIAEAKAMARLSHPNVCTVYEVGTTKDRVFLAMEYVHGDTLSKWLQTPRTWREVAEVMAAAGEGIAAAHAAGVIHRDLKPDNIMIGRDGRVRVMDFGIAIGARNSERAASKVGVEREDISSSLAGTPSYMAPELLAGQPASEATDQFALAVTMYEALYGVRPYPGRSFSQILDSYQAAALHEPKKSSIPRWLRQIALQGIALEAGERFSNVAALVEEMNRVPRRRRIWALSLLGALLVALGVLATLVLARNAGERGNPCTGAEGLFAETWSPQRQQAVERALMDSGMQEPAQQWQRVAKLVEDYGARWSVTRTEACEATRVRGEQSDELLDRRTICLDRRRKEVHELVSILGDADRELAQRAAEAVLALEPPEYCDGKHLAGGRRALPADPATRLLVEELQDRLANLKAFYDMGRARQVRTQVQELASNARTTEHQPLIAASRLLEGRVLGHLNELEAAEQALIASWLAAEACGDDQGKLEAMNELIVQLAWEGGRTTEAERWVAYASATVARVGDMPHLESMYWHGRGAIATQTAKYEQSVAYHGKALELRTRAVGDQHFSLAAHLSALGAALQLAGDLEEARVALERARAVVEASVGQNHPMAAEVINNLGNVHLRAGRLEDARTSYREAYRIWSAFFSAGHSKAAVALTNLGNVSFAEEEYGEARKMYQQALDIERDVLGADNSNIAPTLLNLGAAQLADFEEAAAVTTLQQALSLVETQQNKPAGDIRFHLARALWDTGEHERGRAMAESARAIYAALGKEGTSERDDVAAWLAERRP